MKTCLLAGATGLTGQYLWPLLAESEAYQAVHLLLRRTVEHPSPKVHQHLVDFDQLDEWQDLPHIDHVYCTLGTTLAKAGSKTAFRKVDHGYIVGMARLAQRLGASCFTFISSIGADADSWYSFYLKVKGQTEKDVAALKLPATFALRPSLLVGPRAEHRPAEAFGEKLFNTLSPLMIGPLENYRAIHVATVAHAMLALTLASEGEGFRAVESSEIAKYQG
ncbi:MAG: NAD-dependent epimerase/dehydratase family protein [Bacteroidota bacterium]